DETVADDGASAAEVWPTINGTEGYPPLLRNESHYVILPAPSDTVVCSYSNGEVNTERFEKFILAVKNDSIASIEAICPKTNHSDAFRLEYLRRNRLDRYYLKYPNVLPHYSFLSLPYNLRQDPLFYVEWDAGDAISRLSSLNNRPNPDERFKVALSDVAEAQRDNDKVMLETIRIVSEICSDLLPVIKRRYPTYGDLCVDYHDAAEAVAISYKPGVYLRNS
ncbi:hypothetical protein FOZ62_030863, partial [Perkinsus olseni]